MTRYSSRQHPVWSLLKCVLLTNLLIGFVTTAYNIQVGMGIVCGTLFLMLGALSLRICGVCPDQITYWSDLPARTPPRAPPGQKQEYVLVTNPDMSMSIGTRAFPSQPSSAAYPPPY